MADLDDDDNDSVSEGADSETEDDPPRKDSNRRADGSYIVGKNRAPVEHQFKTNDGRKRGRREKGTKNLKTSMRLAMNKRITLKGKRKPGVEWVAEQLVVRAITGSDRAVEILLRHLGDDDEHARGAVSMSDQKVLDEYFRQRFVLETGTNIPTITDDFDNPDEGSEPLSDDKDANGA